MCKKIPRSKMYWKSVQGLLIYSYVDFERDCQPTFKQPYSAYISLHFVSQIIPNCMTSFMDDPLVFYGLLLNLQVRPYQSNVRWLLDRQFKFELYSLSLTSVSAHARAHGRLSTSPHNAKVKPVRAKPKQQQEREFLGPEKSRHKRRRRCSHLDDI